MIVAQSIGGGGGVASFSTTSAAAGSTVGTSFALGGQGNSGGHGNTVNVNIGTTAALGTIATQGMNANGIVAQSIGGGGGIASFALAPRADGSITNGTVGGRLGFIGAGSNDLYANAVSVTVTNTAISTSGLLVGRLDRADRSAVAAASRGGVFGVERVHRHDDVGHRRQGRAHRCYRYRQFVRQHQYDWGAFARHRGPEHRRRWRAEPVRASQSCPRRWE